MRSDAYTITFTTIVTVILGLGLSYTADSLRDRQILNEELRHHIHALVLKLYSINEFKLLSTHDLNE